VEGNFFLMICGEMPNFKIIAIIAGTITKTKTDIYPRTYRSDSVSEFKVIWVKSPPPFLAQKIRFLRWAKERAILIEIPPGYIR